MDNWQDRINIDPKILGGKPVIKGRRVAVEVLVGALAGSMSLEEVCREWAVTPEDVRAALAYAADLVAEETVHALPGG